MSFFVLNRPRAPHINEGHIKVLAGPLHLGVWTWLQSEIEKVMTGEVPAKPTLWIRVGDLDDDDES